MDEFVDSLREEYPDLLEQPVFPTQGMGNDVQRHVVYTQAMDNYNIAVRDFQAWWTDGPNRNYPYDLQLDFSGAPYHITSLSNAFRILTSGHIIPGPGQHQRFGENSNIIYFGFPDFSRKNFSAYGSVSFRVTPNSLFGENPRFHYRYTMCYTKERSHLFLLSHGEQLPNVALRPYNVSNVNNGIWWRVADEVHFRKKNDYEYIEFAVLRNNVDDAFPISNIDEICFQRKETSLGNDRPGFSNSKWYLVLSLALYYLGDIPEKVLSKFGEIFVEPLTRFRDILLEAFDDNLDEDKDLVNPFINCAITVDQTEPPVDTVCRLLGEFVSNEAHTGEVPTFRSGIHYLRQSDSWMLSALKVRVVEIFKNSIAVVEAHDKRVVEKLFSESLPDDKSASVF